MSRILAVVALGLSLASCEYLMPRTQTVPTGVDPAVLRLVATCTTFGEVVRDLAVHRRLGTIGEDTEKAIDLYVAVGAEICEADPPYGSSNALDRLEATLEAIALEKALGEQP